MYTHTLTQPIALPEEQLFILVKNILIPRGYIIKKDGSHILILAQQDKRLFAAIILDVSRKTIYIHNEKSWEVFAHKILKEISGSLPNYVEKSLDLDGYIKKNSINI